MSCNFIDRGTDRTDANLIGDLKFRMGNISDVRFDSHVLLLKIIVRLMKVVSRLDDEYFIIYLIMPLLQRKRNNKKNFIVIFCINFRHDLPVV